LIQYYGAVLVHNLNSDTPHNKDTLQNAEPTHRHIIVNFHTNVREVY